jgi:hypothetical protein
VSVTRHEPASGGATRLQVGAFLHRSMVQCVSAHPSLTQAVRAVGSAQGLPVWRGEYSRVNSRFVDLSTPRCELGAVAHSYPLELQELSFPFAFAMFSPPRSANLMSLSVQANCRTHRPQKLNV